MTTTETSHALQATSAETHTSPEKKRQQEFQHNIAAVALLAALIAAYSSRESDPLFSAPESAAKTPEDKKSDPQTNRAELIGLINNIFTNDKYWAAPHRTAHRAESRYTPDDEFALGGVTFKNFYGDYREALFSPHKSEFKAAPPKAAPEFTPAPSMSDTELGPELPKVAFNDRIRPVGQQPSGADFAAADRATDMYQRALYDKGWRGGEASAEQAKKAGKKMHFDYNPDRNPDISPGDLKAYETFSANQAKPTTNDEGTFTERPS